MLEQISAQQLNVEPVANLHCARMGVHIDQTGHQPPLADQLRIRHGIRRPPIAIGIQIDWLTLGQRETPDPQHPHAADTTARGESCERADGQCKQ